MSKETMTMTRTSHLRRLSGRALAVALVSLAATLLAAASAAAAGPAWSISATPLPTNFAPGGTGIVAVLPQNVGDGPSGGTITVKFDPLPAGLTATALAGKGIFGAIGSPWACDLSTLTCTTTQVAEGGRTPRTVVGLPTYPSPVTLSVVVDPGAPAGPVDVSATVSEGAGSSVSTTRAVTISPASATFGIEPSAFTAKASRADGAWETQAGGHPYSATTSFDLNTSTQLPGFQGAVRPVGSVKNVVVDLPPGFVGNPQAVSQCSPYDFLRYEGVGVAATTPNCPASSQVGVATLRFINFKEWSAQGEFPVYNLAPGEGEPGTFGFQYAGALITMHPTLRSNGDYGLTITLPNVSQALPILGGTVTFWGTPADPSHDDQRARDCTTRGCTLDTPAGIPPRPFLTNPTDCAETPETTISVDSWQSAGSFIAPITAEVPPPATGCDKLSFNPTVSFQPTTRRAATPTGLDVDIHLPQNESPTGVATPSLKKAVVTLPAGMTVNPSSAGGLGSCSPAQIGLDSTADADCPASSKIGDIQIDTPLLEKQMQGSIYLAKQNDNPFHSLLGLYLVAKGPGVIIKLPGKVEADQATGQLTATFDENPQLPFEDLHLQFKSGPRAPLITPANCGTYSIETRLTPWAAPNATPATPSDSFQITSGPNGGPCPTNQFDPGFHAGTTNPVAGTYSPFVLRLTREDGTQALSGVTAKLPEGLTGKLAGIPYCSDAALGGVSGAEGTGEAQLASPSCPAASQIGTVTVGAGAGPSPFYVNTGKAYLAGPYKGAPLSMAFVTPAVAGPFDLGNVVVRAALQVNSRTAQITAASDPLPTILHGIPLDLRDVRVNIDRAGFTLNPTSCEPTAVTGAVTSTEGAAADVSDRFQVGDCGALGFKPHLKLNLKGATGRTGHPALKAVVTYPKQGLYSNIARAQVGLPHSEFLDQGNLNKVCKQADLQAGTCPKSSIYGRARAWTPLLDKPLEGPVYLGVGFGYKLPALVADLNGQIRILLVGKVDTTKHKGIRNTFEVVPDAPVSRFVLTMKGGKKYGLLENSEDICRRRQRASALFTAQNGMVEHVKPKIANDCGKKGKAVTHKGHQKQQAKANRRAGK